MDHKPEFGYHFVVLLLAERVLVVRTTTDVQVVHLVSVVEHEGVRVRVSTLSTLPYQENALLQHSRKLNLKLNCLEMLAENLCKNTSECLN